MFEFFKSKLEVAHGSEKKIKKAEEVANRKINEADTEISRGEDNGLRGSGVEYGYKVDRAQGYEDLKKARLSGERLAYYTDVKKEVGTNDVDVLEKMKRDAIEEDKKSV